jgi:hypothetical protein
LLGLGKTPKPSTMRVPRLHFYWVEMQAANNVAGPLLLGSKIFRQYSGKTLYLSVHRRMYATCERNISSHYILGWLDRAIEATLANTTATPTLRYVRGVLRSWRERTTDDVSAYGTRRTTVHASTPGTRVGYRSRRRRDTRRSPGAVAAHPLRRATTTRQLQTSRPGSVTARCSSWTRARLWSGSAISSSAITWRRTRSVRVRERCSP